MRAVRLAAGRSRARGGLLLAMLAVVGVVTFLLAGMVGYLGGATDAAVRETFADAPATTASLQLSTRLAKDSAAQTDAVRQVIGEAFAGTEIAAHRIVRSNPVAAGVAGETAFVILTADPNLGEHATLVDGSWPDNGAEATPVPAAVQATAADQLGVAVGDEFTVEGRRLVVAATWLPVDVTEPYWFADPAVASGFDRLSLGPVVIPEAVLAELPVRSYARWTIVPDATALGAASLPRLSVALDQLAAGVERVGTTEGIELSGGLREHIGMVQRGVGVAGGLVSVPAVLVAVIGLITVAQLARLLVAVRRSETVLLRARGASVLQLTAVTVVEAALVSVVGAAFGAAVVAMLLVAVQPSAGVRGLWSVAPVVAGAAILLSAVIAWRAASTGVGPAHGDSGRVRSSVTGGVSVLVFVAAGLSLWQFKLYGSPLLVGTNGSIQVDPLTVVAPALTLLALALLGLLAFGPVARLIEKVVARGAGIIPLLPTRQVARRVSVFGVALLLVTLSVSGATLAATYSQSWSTASATAAQLRNGADVRVRLTPPPTVEGPSSLVTTVPYLRLDGARDAATVLAAPARIADDHVELTAASALRMPTVLLAAGGAADPAHVATDLAAEPSGVLLNGAELDVTVSATSSIAASAGSLEVFAWLDDADGSIAKLSLGTVALAEALEDAAPVRAALPEARAGGWWLLGLEVMLSGADGARGVDVTVAGPDRDYAMTVSSTDPSARALAYTELQQLPVVVTDALAERLSLHNGTVVTMRIPNTASVVDAVVVGTTGVVPGAQSRLGLVADLPTLNRYLLATSTRMPQPSEVWLSADTGADLVAPAIAASRTAGTVTTLSDGSSDRLVAPAMIALWWGVAGTLVLAVIAVLAITTTFARDRRSEVVVLRAIGMSSSEQGRSRLVELVAVVGAAVVTGIVTGLVASALTVGELATTATGAVVPVALRFDLLGWLALVFALGVGLLTISTGYAGRVARQARDTEYREETR